MTDFPSPSDRPKGAKGATFGLFRPVLFAIGVIGLAMGGLVLSHRSNPDIASLPPKPPAIPSTPAPAAPAPAGPAQAVPGPVILADSQPAPPVTAADFGKPASLDLRGFQMKPPEAPTADAEPPASDIYELTLRLEKGDTVEKMLADIDVAESERKDFNL